jgi:hypothetical protein
MAAAPAIVIAIRILKLVMDRIDANGFYARCQSNAAGLGGILSTTA